MGARRGEKLPACPRCGKRGLVRRRSHATVQIYEARRVCRYCGFSTDEARRS